ncbi:MAG: hypothetical protein J0L92_24915 [Deltaproteobacteria bacterium]|nr:hypothetical protein [Deltaproteobacteria bacterium]
MIRVSWLVVALALGLVTSAPVLAQSDPHAADPQAANGAQAATPTDEDTLRAREAFQVAVSLYGAGRYLEAAREFQRSYELSHEAGLLRNLYLALRDAGDVRGARTALRGYLDAGAPDTTEDDRRLLQHRLEALDRAIAEEDAQRRSAPTATTTDPPTVDPPAETTTATTSELGDPTTDEPEGVTPQRDDAWIWAVVLGGVVLVGGGVALAVALTTPGPGLDADVPGRIETLTLASGRWSAP